MSSVRAGGLCGTSFRAENASCKFEKNTPIIYLSVSHMQQYLMYDTVIMNPKMRTFKGRLLM